VVFPDLGYGVLDNAMMECRRTGTMKAFFLLVGRFGL
jgi:hypothetical protein